MALYAVSVSTAGHSRIKSTHMSSSLLDLPLELLFLIKNYLSPVDTACLALCNHQLLVSLSPNFVTGLEPLLMRLDFLARISRDLEKLTSVLHVIVYIPGALLVCLVQLYHCQKCSPDPLLLEGRSGFGSRYPCYTGLNFHFVHLQLAMRKFYYGTMFGIDAEKLRYTEISTLPLERNESFWSTPTPSLTTKIRQDFMTLLISVAAKVCPAAPGPTFCLRIQEIAQASRENIGRISPLAAQKTTTMEVCQHIKVYSIRHEPGLRGTGGMEHFDPVNIITSLIAQYSSGADDHPVQCRTCRICGIIWKLELRVSQDEKDIFIVSTRWLDLGPGLSPEDWQWKFTTTIWNSMY